MPTRIRRVASAGTILLAVAALGACTSTPGNRRVVSDVIESLQLPASEEQCMLDKLDGYSDDQLSEIADENENWNPASGSDTLEEASPGMRAFIDDYAECRGDGAATPTASSGPTGSSGPTASSEVPDTTDG